MGFDLGLGMGHSSSNGGTATSGSSTEKSTVTSGNEVTQKSLDALVQQLMGQYGTAGSEYSKTNAIQDAQGQVQSIFDTFKKTFLPQVYQGQNGTGGYNSTSGQLMANDGYAAAVSKSAATVLGNITAYGQLSNTEKENTLQGVLASLNLGENANKTTDVASSFNTLNSTWDVADTKAQKLGLKGDGGDLMALLAGG